MSANWSDYTKTEGIRQTIGTGDHATEIFSVYVRGPILPGSVHIRVMPADAVSQLGALTGEAAFEMACCDVSQNGILHGDVQSGTLNYDTGSLMVTWKHAPSNGATIVLFYKRRLHKLHRAKVQVKLGGKKRWVSLRDLWLAINNL